jgi:RNA polymerase sigma-70 factor (ECF subfamily)
LDQVRDEEVLNSVPADSTEQNYMAEYIEFLPELVSNLSPACRAVLVLHYFEEMPLNEVADVLGIAVGTVKSRLAYGLARLREILGDRAEESRLGRI